MANISSVKVIGVNGQVVVVRDPMLSYDARLDTTDRFELRMEGTVALICPVGYIAPPPDLSEPRTGRHYNLADEDVTAGMRTMAEVLPVMIAWQGFDLPPSPPAPQVPNLDESVNTATGTVRITVAPDMYVSLQDCQATLVGTDGTEVKRPHLKSHPRGPQEWLALFRAIAVTAGGDDKRAEELLDELICDACFYWKSWDELPGFQLVSGDIAVFTEGVAAGIVTGVEGDRVTILHDGRLPDPVILGFITIPNDAGD